MKADKAVLLHVFRVEMALTFSKPMIQTLFPTPRFPSMRLAINWGKNISVRSSANPRLLNKLCNHYVDNQNNHGMVSKNMDGIS